MLNNQTVVTSITIMMLNKNDSGYIQEKDLIL
jgi:hypothetical protein